MTASEISLPRCTRCGLFVRRGAPCEVCQLRAARATRNAIRQFLDFGEQSVGTAHGGYFSPGGWAYETMRQHLAELGEPTIVRQLPPPLRWWQFRERIARWQLGRSLRLWRCEMGKSGGLLISWRKRGGAA